MAIDLYMRADHVVLQTCARVVYRATIEVLAADHAEVQLQRVCPDTVRHLPTSAASEVCPRSDTEGSTDARHSKRQQSSAVHPGMCVPTAEAHHTRILAPNVHMFARAKSTNSEVYKQGSLQFVLATATVGASQEGRLRLASRQLTRLPVISSVRAHALAAYARMQCAVHASCRQVHLALRAQILLVGMESIMCNLRGTRVLLVALVRHRYTARIHSLSYHN